jgi:hypothetical protein
VGTLPGLAMSRLSSEERGLVLGVEERGDRFWLLHWLGVERGLGRGLLRRSRRAARPDFLDSARVRFEADRSGRELFLAEYTLTRRRTAIGRGYERMQVAYRVAALVRANGDHWPESGELVDLLETFAEAIAEGRPAEPARLKTLFRMGRMQGLPVREDWWVRLSRAEQQRAEFLLGCPLADLGEGEVGSARALADGLEEWLGTQAGFRVPVRKGERVSPS